MRAREYVEQYRSVVEMLHRKIVDEEFEALQKAANLMVDAIAEDRLIHVVGTGGHSFLSAEEMFCRAGGLANINPIFEQGLAITMGGLRSLLVERLPNYMPHVLEYYGVNDGDVLIVVNAYGINGATIDAALEGKRRGAKVIAISSPQFSNQIPADHVARHPSKKNLHELAEVDVHIDCKMPYPDAIIEFESLEQRVAPVSNLCNFFVVNQLVIVTVATLIEKGIEPPIWTSGNIPGGDEKNEVIIDKYFNRIKHL